MAVLDFPASPTNGQLYPAAPNAQYIYNATAGGPSVGAWESLPMQSAKTVTDDVAPLNPADGDQWFSTVDGVLYIYVVDVDGGQWVESRSAIISDGYYSPNYIINGGFDINQRGVTSSGIGTNQYGLDRWRSESSTGTVTQSVQQFTPGSAPVAGIEAKQYARIVTSGQTGTGAFSAFLQKIEDVRTLANKPYTLSFYARVASGTATISADFAQNFDNGGTGDTRTPIAIWTATTSWQRFSATFTPPSIAGKTIGAASVANIIMWQSSGSSIAFLSGFTAVQNNTFDYWGVQLEEGSVATPFRRNANSIQGELAACQRYYVRFTASANDTQLCPVTIFTASAAYAQLSAPVEMRTKPSAIEYSSVSDLRVYRNNGNVTPTGIALYAGGSTFKNLAFSVTIPTSTAGQIGWIEIQPSGSYIAFTAEL